MSLSVDALRGSRNARGQVDHRLMRQSLINEYRRGRLSQEQVRLVTYVFGSRLPAHGRCVSTAKELAALDRRRDELWAYVVEACVGCHWHHLRQVLPVGGR